MNASAGTVGLSTPTAKHGFSFRFQVMLVFKSVALRAFFRLEGFHLHLPGDSRRGCSGRSLQGHPRGAVEQVEQSDHVGNWGILLDVR